MTALGLPPGHSAAFNYGWSAQYSAAVSWTDPLPRYLPGLWSGLGGHDFFFYAPLPFWVIAVLVAPFCPGCSPATEFVLGSSVFLVASGAAMFAFLRRFFAVRPAAVGALVYVVLPYHLLIDWFVRQAAGEFAAYAFLPLVALGIERVRQQDGGGWILALGVAGTALCHLPTTLLAAHAFGAVVLAFVILQPKGLGPRLRLFARYAWFGGLGLALAAVYWLPAVLLLDTVSPATLFDPYFQAWRWLYFGTEPTPNAQFATRVLVSFLACVPLLFGALRSARGALLVWILVPAALAVFLNTAPSAPIWREWIIAKVQFPWRLMILVDFAAALAAAVLASRLAHRADRLFLGAAAMACVVAASYLGASLRTSAPDPTYRDWYAAAEYLSPEMTQALQSRHGVDRLDHFDKDLVADTLGAMAAEVRADPATATILNRRSRSMTVQPSPGVSVVSLPVQYWSLWQAHSGSTALLTRPHPVFGTLDILAPPAGFAAAPVTVTLPFQPVERAGAVLSLLALLLLAATMLRPRRSIDSPPNSA